MKKKGKILRVICPLCRKKEMFLRKIGTSNKFDPPSAKMKHWVCHDCVSIYPEDWFDIFYQHEFLVLREKEDKEEWYKGFVQDEGQKANL